MNFNKIYMGCNQKHTKQYTIRKSPINNDRVKNSNYEIGKTEDAVNNARTLIKQRDNTRN